MKYDKIVAMSQEESQQKIRIAQKAISGMLNNMEKITVTELVRRTGLSRGFFYKNPIVRAEMEDAMRRQEAMIKSVQPGIADKAIEDRTITKQIEILKLKAENEKLCKRNRELQDENDRLEHEIEKLHRQLNRKETAILKSL